MKAKILWLLLPLAIVIAGCEPKNGPSSNAVTNSVNTAPAAIDSLATNPPTSLPPTNTPPQP